MFRILIIEVLIKFVLLRVPAFSHIFGENISLLNVEECKPVTPRDARIGNAALHRAGWQRRATSRRHRRVDAWAQR